jgi:hypothetical protein
VTYSGVTSIEIDLGDGNDEVNIFAVNMPKLTINTGAGNDWIYFRGTTRPPAEPPPEFGPIPHFIPNPPMMLDIQGDLAIDTGNGHDVLQAAAYVNGNAVVQMGAGDDFYSPFAFGTNYFGYISTGFGEFNATGTMTLDLGPDQNIDLAPTTWQSEPRLVQNLEWVVRFLDYYQDLVDAGEDTPGTPQYIQPPGLNLARIDAEGRLEVEFNFIHTNREVVDRLLERGVTIDAYNIRNGVGRASIRREDLDLFSNLPGLTWVSVHYYQSPLTSFNGRSGTQWDYTRPGSVADLESYRPKLRDRFFSVQMGPYRRM